MFIGRGSAPEYPRVIMTPLTRKQDFLHQLSAVSTARLWAVLLFSAFAVCFRFTQSILINFSVAFKNETDLCHRSVGVWVPAYTDPMKSSRIVGSESVLSKTSSYKRTPRKYGSCT